MAVTVNINGTDRSKSIELHTLNIQTVLTQQVDTANFDFKYESAQDIIPQCGQDVKVYNNATVVFAGVINRVFIKTESYNMRIYDIHCVDYKKLLDHKLVIDTYEDQTVNQIVTDIVDNYCERFTYANVDCGLTVDYIAFNYEQPSQCLKQLAELFNYDWYIDENKDIHFFSKETNTAPYEIDDTSGYYEKDTLRVRRDHTKLRNSIIVRGGEYIGDTITFEQEADGEQTYVPTQYKLTDINVTVSTHAEDVGIDYIDDEDNYDCLYNFNEKIVKWKDADKPANGTVVKISGKPYLPVIVKVKDNESIATISAVESTTSVEYDSSGIYEHKIVDKSIKTKAGARDRAKAELYAYANTLVEAEFSTLTDGFKTGQRIRINSTAVNTDEWFVINRINARMFTEDTLIYHVSMVTTRTIDFVDFLQKILTSKDKEIEIKENEVVDEIETVDDDIDIIESVDIATAMDISDSINIDESVATSLTSVYRKWGPGYNAQWGLCQWA